MTIVLGIETSCDETAAAVLQDGRMLLSNVVSSQVDLHKQYGGVFPEMASRQHILSIVPVVRQALAEAQVGWQDIDAIAAVHGPGLAGALLVGMNTAKALALALDKPLVGVNHLEAHIYANWLETAADGSAGDFTPPAFPLVCLIVSGGHTDLVLMREHHDYERLGRTIDDAAGEAFDKVARLLGLGYPGGPLIERAGQQGNPQAFSLPRSLPSDNLNFSFSGLKTAVLRLVLELQHGDQALEVGHGQKLADAAQQIETSALPLADLAASFEAAVVDALVQRTVEAARRYRAVQVLMAGGVAANKRLRAEMGRALSVPLRYPPIRFCTDNAAMVAMAGYFHYLAGVRSGLDLDVIPNLALV